MSQTQGPNPQKQDDASNKSSSRSLLANSARGATFLISLQVGSRALTFIINQVLLRHLSPELLGISAQLELYSTTVLFLARESLRVALLRLSAASGEDEQEREGPGAQLQDVVNVSYIAVALGPILAYAFGRLYLDNAADLVLLTPYLKTCLILYAISTIFELLSEPCFVVAQHQMLYGVRASAEASATFAKCLTSCSTAIWASSSNWDIGVLPFAVGQLTYALVLLVVYYGGLWHQTSSLEFSMMLRSRNIDPSKYLFSLFPWPALSLATNLYGQSVLKHLLTQGDAFLSALFTTACSQGAFTVASNYGSLLARMVFQPIEESSRGVFSRLLGSPESSASSASQNKISSERPARREGEASQSSVTLARTYLVTILRLYGILSIFIVCFGPTLAPILLGLVAGRQWAATSAASVLSLYCYYIPLLALNGILEAFVASVASSATLQAQSGWMLGISAGFAVASYVLLRVYELGAHGLVLTNGVNMLMRILWSGRFVRGYFSKQGAPLSVTASPRPLTMIAGLAAAWVLGKLGVSHDGSIWSLMRIGSIAAVDGFTMLFLERYFLVECYRLLRPAQTPLAGHGRRL